MLRSETEPMLQKYKLFIRTNTRKFKFLNPFGAELA